MKVGLFGGTFDPVHLGHLRAAEEAREILELDKIIFVPARTPPHKSADAVGEARRRLALVKAAVADNPFFEVSDIEILREGPSYTVDTLKAVLGAKDAPEKLWFIAGADAFADMGSWKSCRELFSLADFAILRRPPFGDDPPVPPKVAADFAKIHGGWRHLSGREVRFVPVTPIDISSTRIRNALKEGRSVRYLVPESVRALLEAGPLKSPGEGNG